MQTIAGNDEEIYRFKQKIINDLVNSTIPAQGNPSDGYMNTMIIDEQGFGYWASLTDAYKEVHRIEPITDKRAMNQHLGMLKVMAATYFITDNNEKKEKLVKPSFRTSFRYY